MKQAFIATVGLLLASLTAMGQSYVKFRENNLMDNASAFGALLCPLDKTKAAEVLKAATTLQVPRKHINGYCEARAHFLSKQLAPLVQSNGCAIGKIWAFAPSLYTMVSDRKLSTANPLFAGEKITWGYHVAPLLAITNSSNKTDTVVIDFSFQDKAFIPYRQWLKKLNCPEAIYTFTDANYYLFYTLDSLKLTGKGFNNYITPKAFPKIITGHFWYLAPADNTSVPSGLAYNDLAVYIVEKYYNSAAHSQYKEQLKALTKLNDMSRLVSRSASNLPVALVDDCVGYYTQRLDYWKTRYH